MFEKLKRGCSEYTKQSQTTRCDMETGDRDIVNLCIDMGRFVLNHLENAERELAGTDGEHMHTVFQIRQRIIRDLDRIGVDYSEEYKPNGEKKS